MRKMRMTALWAALLVIAACNGGGGEKEKEPVSGEVTYTQQIDMWTYISFESGTVVGTSKLGDEAQDDLWAVREDWDIAVCDSLLKTNGGSSGMGRGAISATSQSSLVTDTKETEIW